MIRALGLSKEEAQEIIKAGGIMQSEVKPILQKLAIADKRYGPAIKEFEIIVPVDYDHSKQIDVFAKKTKKETTTYYFNDDITSKHFANASTKLVPGKTYKVKIFPILARVTSEDNMAFLAKQNAILAGDHGLTLVYEQKKEELPKDKYTVSFDKKESLWKDADGRRRVPVVYASSGGGFGSVLVASRMTGMAVIGSFASATLLFPNRLNLLVALFLKLSESLTLRPFALSTGS
ncbi:MAG: hypothetical protein WCX46_03335, partial [Candidatus Paceibacterota bacterium]